MKLTPILMCLLLASMSLNAQDDTSPPSARNEVRLNAIHTLIGFGELTYERSFGADMSVGVSVGGRLDPEIEWLWGVTPFFRAYFGDIGGPIFKTNHDGFFLRLTQLLDRGKATGGPYPMALFSQRNQL